MADLLGVPFLAAWLVPFALHSTALLGFVLLGGRVLRRLPDPVHDAVLKFALLASLVTATLQVALVPEPAAGHLATGFQSPAAPPPVGWR